MKSFIDHVGYVLFPRRPDDLTNSTLCPACFTPLTSTLCSQCGLHLSHPAAAELAAVSATAAHDMQQRLEIIGRIRFETAAAATPVPAVVAPAPVVAAPAAAPAPAANAVADVAPRRHFGVQVILLIVGVSLLSIGAIFFLVYAFITFGLVWRSIIIGAVTVAAFAGASLLRWRRLGATAEAIAVLAVVFVYLDAFAVRANDLFGAGSTGALTYWGSTLLLSSVGFLAWHRLSGLRMASIAGFTAFVPGVALLVAGLTEPLDTPERIFASLAAAAAAGLVHVVARISNPPLKFERVLPLALAGVALIAAGGTAFTFDYALVWAPAIGLGVVGVLALAHVVVLVRTGGDRFFGPAMAAIGAAAASVAGWSTAVRSNDTTWIIVAAPLAASVIALAIEFVARRAAPVAQAPALAGQWAATVVGALALLPALGATLFAALSPALNNASPGPWSLPATDDLGLRTINFASVIALAAVVLVAAFAWALGGVLRARRLVVLWALYLVVLLAVPLLGMLWTAVAGWLLLAAVAVVGLIAARGRGSGIRLLLATTAGVSLALAYAASWTSVDTWWWASIVSVLVVLAARFAVTAAPARAVLIGIAAVLTLVAAGATGSRLNSLYEGGDATGLEAAHTVSIAAVVLLGLAAALGLLSALERRVLFWMSGATLVVTVAASWSQAGGGAELALVDPLASLVTGVALVGVLLLWVLVPRTSALTIERIVASVAIAPATAWVADSVTRQFALDDFVTSIAPVSAALLVAALALALARPPRWPWDAGIALVTIPAVAAAVFARADATWLVLLLAGVTALLVAVSRTGLFATETPRRHLGWVALGLATAGLWWRLGDDGVTALEAYVLPLGGALLAVAILAWRANRADPTAPYIALGGLLVALVPIAVDAVDDAPRLLAVAAASIALLLVGSLVAGSTALRPYLDAAAAAGAAGTLVAGLGRSYQLSIDRALDTPELDLWLVATVGLLFVAAAGLARSSTPGRRAVIGQAVMMTALTGALLLELTTMDPGTAGSTRALGTIILLCLLYVAALLVNRVPLSRAVGWTAVSFAAATAAWAIARNSVEPLEWATAPIGLALLVVGVVHLRREPSAGSWAWLAPGILLLLLPSLVATFVEQPAWRLVGLGVACLACIMVGALRRLQAPLLIGTVIVLVHAIRTFSPQLRAVYEATEWWVWAVIGGAIVLFVALTFEKRVRDLKSVGSTIALLR